MGSRMKTKLKIDGVLKDVEIHEDFSITTIESKQHKQTGWENVVDNTFWDRYFTSSGNWEAPLERNDLCSFAAHSLYETADYFSDKTLAQNIIRAQEIWRRLLRWQAENDVPIIWSDFRNPKYYICYDYKYGTIEARMILLNSDAFGVYLSSRSKAEEAIEVFKEDLTWLFTKFKSRMDLLPKQKEQQCL